MDQKIIFRCECGKSLHAPMRMAEHRGKCKYCGTLFIVPSAQATGLPDPPPTEPDSMVQQVCSYCLTEVEQHEPQAVCNECEQPFHAECWEENRGCTTYGCRNVDALKPEPDISVPAPPPLPATRTFASSQQENRPAQFGSDDIPWEFVLLAASAIAGLIGLFCYGVPSLATSGAAVAYLTSERENSRSPAVYVSLALSVVGFLIGFLMG